ncbi:hypothetical protein KJ840_03005 [Patescibacteria group bacterium]|nr:hypothetical protein [Patescibacteria group bacterium]
MKKFIYILFPIVGLIIAAAHIIAAGISVSPNSLFFSLPVNDKETKTLTINNISTAPQIYNLYSDELTDIITINPTIFRLEPGEDINVSITVRPRQDGALATNISVVAEDIDRRKFNAAAGVKIPVEIIAKDIASSFFQKNFFWFIITISLLIIAADVIIIIRRRRHLTFWQKIKQLVNSIFKR